MIATVAAYHRATKAIWRRSSARAATRGIAPAPVSERAFPRSVTLRPESRNQLAKHRYAGRVTCVSATGRWESRAATYFVPGLGACGATRGGRDAVARIPSGTLLATAAAARQPPRSPANRREAWNHSTGFGGFV